MRTPVAMDAVPEIDAKEAIIGRSKQMQEVYKAIGRVAGSDVTVLIKGETGTGKELVARAIYQHSPGRDWPFLAMNCAAIPENLLESELFGHEKGAFTGAEQRRVGKFEQANGGTLFLDEVGDMSFSIQAKILRLLQKDLNASAERHHPRRIGAIITATHRDLENAIEEGLFRDDLYYRLKWSPSSCHRCAKETRTFDC